MLENVPISLSGPAMNIKLALKLCHFDTLGGYNNLIGGMGLQYFYTAHYEKDSACSLCNNNNNESEIAGALCCQQYDVFFGCW